MIEVIQKGKVRRCGGGGGGGLFSRPLIPPPPPPPFFPPSAFTVFTDRTSTAIPAKTLLPRQQKEHTVAIEPSVTPS
jgi:hypothetical protein